VMIGGPQDVIIETGGRPHRADLRWPVIHEREPADPLAPSASAARIRRPHTVVETRGERWRFANRSRRRPLNTNGPDRSGPLPTQLTCKLTVAAEPDLQLRAPVERSAPP
jgi:hypothetical protein